VGILRIVGFGLIGFSIWAGMRARTAPTPEVPVKVAQPSQAGSPAAYPFPRKPTAPRPPVHSIVGSLASPPAKEEASRASVTGNAVFLRTLPRKRSAPLGKLNAGAKVFILEQRGNWVRVRPEPPSREGWMSTRYVSRTQPTERFRPEVDVPPGARAEQPSARDGMAASLVPPGTRP
jgi:hypothetical protein